MTLTNDSIVNVLQNADKAFVTFDPKNNEHRNAYRKYLLSGKQDKMLRFRLERGFRSVPEMLQYKMAEAGLRALDALDLLKTIEESAPVKMVAERVPFASVN